MLSRKLEVAVGQLQDEDAMLRFFSRFPVVPEPRGELADCPCVVQVRKLLGRPSPDLLTLCQMDPHAQRPVMAKTHRASGDSLSVEV